MSRILILIVVSFSLTFKAQPPTCFFTSFGSSGEDAGYSVIQVMDKNYVIAGSSSGNFLNGTDVYLTKLDTMGNIIWQAFYGGTGNEVAKSIIELPDSGYVFAGLTNSFGAGGYDAYIGRVNKRGKVIWQTTFGGLSWDFANDLVLGSDGKIYVVGYTESFGSGKRDGFIVKYDLSGNLIWQKFIGGVEDDELKSVIVTNDNFLATVGKISTKDVNGDIYFQKFDSNGDTIWTKTIGGVGTDYGNDIVQKVTNNYVIGGARTFTVSPYTQSYMFSMSATGLPTWENYYNSSNGDEEIVAVTNSYQDPDYTAYLRNVPVPAFKTQGNIFVGRYGGWAVKVNSYGGSDEENFYSLIGIKDGGYLSVGRTSSFSLGGNDVFFIKLDSTVIKYSNVVSTKEIEKDNRIRLLKKAAKVFQVQGDFKNNQTLCYSVFEVEGRLLKSGKLEDATSIIDLNELRAGYLLLGITLEDGSRVFFKLINE